MASTRGERRLMFFIAIDIFVACLVAIAALVLAAIMISMVRSGNTPLLLILIPTYKVRNSKRLRVSRHAKFECLSVAHDVLFSKCLGVSFIDLLNVDSSILPILNIFPLSLIYIFMILICL